MTRSIQRSSSASLSSLLARCLQRFLCQRRTFSALKMQTRQAGPDGNTRGGKYHQRRETVIVVLESVAKTKFCTFRLRESLFTFIEVTKPDP